ncbi:MAG: hypothetical protein ACO1RA_05460 [Planctomycetaceae bacterium]
MSFLSFFGLGKRKSSWPEGIPRFYPDIADKDLIPIIPQHVLDERARWPILMILPLASRDSEVDDIALGVGLSRQLVYDLLLIHGLSVRDSGDTPQVYLEAAHKQRKDHDPTIYISGTTTAGPGFTRVELSLFFPGRPVAPATVIHETDFPTFYRNLFLAIAQGCGGQVDDTFIEKMLQRLPTREGLTELGRLLTNSEERTSDVLEGLLERDATILALFHTGTCGSLPLHLLPMISEDLPGWVPPIHNLWPDVFQKVVQFPEDVQLLQRIPWNIYRGQNKDGIDVEKHPGVLLQISRRLLELAPGYADGYLWAHGQVPSGDYRRSLCQLLYRLMPNDKLALEIWTGELLEGPQSPDTFAQISELIEEGLQIAASHPRPTVQLLWKKGSLTLKAMLFRKHQRTEEAQEIERECKALEKQIIKLAPEFADVYDISDTEA